MLSCLLQFKLNVAFAVLMLKYPLSECSVKNINQNNSRFSCLLQLKLNVAFAVLMLKYPPSPRDITLMTRLYSGLMNIT
jgi:hypothetical protein